MRHEGRSRMARRKVAPTPVLKDREAVDRALATLRVLDREQTRDQAGLDQEVEALQVRYRERMDGRAAGIKRVEKDLKEWAEAHKKNLEVTEKKRSVCLPNGVVGFHRSKELGRRTGYTWGKVSEALQRVARWPSVVKAIEAAAGKFAPYLRVKVEPDKEALKKDILGGKLTERDAARLGVKVNDKDTFYFDVTTDETAATIPVDGAARRAG